MAETDSSKSGLNLTARDQEIITQVLLNLKGGGDIQVDYAGLAAALGLKNANTASAVWGALKKKLFAGKTPAAASTDGQSASTKPKTPRKTKELKSPTTPKSSKKATKSETKVKDEGSASPEIKDVEAQVTEATIPSPTPTSTPKKRGRKTKAEKDAEAAAATNGETKPDVDEEKPAKKARKSPAKKSPAVVKKDDEANGANNDGEAEAATVTAEAEAETAAETAKQAQRAAQAIQAAEANEVLAGKKVVTTTTTSTEASSDVDEAEVPDTDTTSVTTETVDTNDDAAVVANA